MRRRLGRSRNHLQVRDAIIQTAIGRMLATQYDLAEPLPAPLADLLTRLKQTDAIGADGNSPSGTRLARTKGSASRTGRGQSRNRHPPEAL
jgi:hypothetical protein